MAEGGGTLPLVIVMRHRGPYQIPLLLGRLRSLLSPIYVDVRVRNDDVILNT